MRVLLVGATGFIGGHIRGQLLARGVEVLATTRRPAGPAAGSLHWARLDLRDAVTPQAWTPLLEGVDAVINAAGVLQDGLSDSTGVVHADAPRALFEACGRAGVRRVIQISAIGVDRQGLTAFSSSKLRGDQALAERDLDWVILRPRSCSAVPSMGEVRCFARWRRCPWCSGHRRRGSSRWSSSTT